MQTPKGNGEGMAFPVPASQGSHDASEQGDRWIFLHSKRTKEVKGIDFERLKLVPIPSIREIGRNGFGKCPLHSDDSPSMKYYKIDNTWWCHQCSHGGDVIDLVQAIKGCTLKEAVKFLV